MMMLEILAQVLPTHPGRFVDVDINLGQTLVAVKSVDPSRSYVGDLSRTQITEFGVHSDLKQCDYGLIPRSNVHRFTSLQFV